MADNPPVVYLLHGEDEYEIAQFVSGLKDKLGDTSLAEMNMASFDGHSFSWDDLVTACRAMPFLLPRRLVILENPLARFNAAPDRKTFLEFLNQVPQTTALVLIEYKDLAPQDRNGNPRPTWLVKWAEKAGRRAYVKSFAIPRGAALAKWIRSRARQAGGEFSSPAAGLLASLVGEDLRTADHEIQKLLAYVNDQRPVEPDDVMHLTAYSGEADIFAMVDALGNRDGKAAQQMLHRLLEEEDPMYIFAMVVRQFRLLLLAREILNSSGNEREVAGQLHIHPYVAKKVTAQARHFDIAVLEAVYVRLLEMDEAIKTGQVETGLGLDLLVADLTV
jgi:DNA polymerase-3 subunit delta